LIPVVEAALVGLTMSSIAYKGPVGAQPSTLGCWCDEEGMSSLEICRKRARRLALAADQFPRLQDSMLPYPTSNHMDIIATAFGVKRKVCPEIHTELRCLVIVVTVLRWCATKQLGFETHCVHCHTSIQVVLWQCPTFAT
jgi:hypothetical protein